MWRLTGQPHEAFRLHDRGLATLYAPSATVRRNRLCLLNRIRAVMNRVAVFSAVDLAGNKAAKTPAVGFKIVKK